eukprot:TRINITY_DN10155_c0_g3_i4.p1 TRINITY_DN10155_c0_g3~~TRINITY_DN10155_c0_g3_i4.p1  ORF type:complete len:200 (+),score=36.06 TRINITY_DN10155_c0_g3_i4:478-1077(+)
MARKGIKRPRNTDDTSQSGEDSDKEEDEDEDEESSTTKKPRLNILESPPSSPLEKRLTPMTYCGTWNDFEALILMAEEMYEELNKSEQRGQESTVLTPIQQPCSNVSNYDASSMKPASLHALQNHDKYNYPYYNYPNYNFHNYNYHAEKKQNPNYISHAPYLTHSSVASLKGIQTYDFGTSLLTAPIYHHWGVGGYPSY